MIKTLVATVLISAMVTAGGVGIPEEAAEEPPTNEPQLEYVGDYTITAYGYYEGGGENYHTAGGYEPTPYYTIAATEEFEMGEILYIEDFGVVQVQDRGAFPDGIIDMHIGYDDIESFPMHETEVYRIKE